MKTVSLVLLIVGLGLYGAWELDQWQQSEQEKTRAAVQGLYEQAFSAGYFSALRDVVLLCRNNRMLQFADAQFSCSEMKKL